MFGEVNGVPFFGVLLTLRILAGSMYEKGEAENLCVNIHDIGQSLRRKKRCKGLSSALASSHRFVDSVYGTCTERGGKLIF